MRIAAHINDAAITLLNSEGITYREPGFALLHERDLTTGAQAFANSRVHPRRVHHRHWAEMATTPLPDQACGRAMRCGCDGGKVWETRC